MAALVELSLVLFLPESNVFCRQYYFFLGVAHPSPRKPRYWRSFKAIVALFSQVWSPSTGCRVCGGCGSAVARALTGAHWAKLG